MDSFKGTGKPAFIAAFVEGSMEWIIIALLVENGNFTVRKYLYLRCSFYIIDRAER